MQNTVKGFPKLASAIAVVFVLSILLACSTRAEDEIVGKWIEVGREGTWEVWLYGSEATWEFRKDGTVSVTLPGDYEYTIMGKYTFIDKDRVKMLIDRTERILIVSISNDQMILTDSKNGETVKYKRFALSSENQSYATGKLVDWNNQPVSGVKIVAVQQGQRVAGYGLVETVTASDGSFKLSGLFPSSVATLTTSVYIIKPRSDKWTTKAQAEITVGPAGETLVIKEPVKIMEALSKDNAHPNEKVVDLITGKTRFSRSEDGVITDSVTNLQWLLGPDKDVTYNQAEQWVAWAAANAAGGGWQMPTREQLKTLYESAVDQLGHIPPLFIRSASAGSVWAEPRDSLSSWYFIFILGDSNSGSRDGSKFNDYAGVLAVRPRK